MERQGSHRKEAAGVPGDGSGVAGRVISASMGVPAGKTLRCTARISFSSRSTRPSTLFCATAGGASAISAPPISAEVAKKA